MDDLVIRPIDITKRIEVAKLYKAIRMAEDASRVPHTRKDRILRKLREDVDRAYMFQRGSRLIGAARISSDPSYRYIKDFAIFKPHQGKGNGTAAFSKLLEVVPGEGPIELDVGIDNDRAQKLYENAGFEKMHQWKSTGNWHMKKDASMLYHASPKALQLLDGMTTRHGATGSVFVSPSKYHASLFALDRQGLINELENKIGKKHIKVNNLSYGQWKDLPSEKKLDHADVYIDTDEEFEPFSGEQKGYLYSMDAEPYKDKIKKWKYDNGDRELLVEGNITPDKQEEISIKYNVHPGRAPWLENYHRVTYSDTGVYQALKEALQPEEWKAFLQEASWLPKPAINYTDAYKSYFTDAGYKKFLEKTMPYIEKHLDKNKIETEHTGIDKTPVYSDKYQAVIAD